MTTYNTGNPIGSTDPRDLLDNAQNLDEALLTDQPTFTDRLGRTRVSWEGATSYSVLSETYSAGIEVTTRNQVILANGEYWKVAGSTTLPHVTTGEGMPEGGDFVSVGDAVLRQDLAAPGGVVLVGNGGIVFDSVADMQAATWITIGQKFRTLGYYTPGDGGGNDYEAVVAGTGTDDGGSFIDLSGSGLQAKALFDGVISVKEFGADGVYGNDDTVSIVAADSFCASLGKTLYFPCGQYCITSSITQNARWLGDGAPELAPFPQLDDDKIYMRPGFKHLLPGSSIILTSGAALSSVATVRSDMFSSMSYAVKTAERYPARIDGVSIILDVDVLDASGALTTPATDNRVECEVGYLVDDASACDFPNLVIFGYWDKAGVAIWSHSVGDNPDYTKFGFGSTMGYYGMALLANDTAAGNGPGLSGTQAYGFQLFGNDHHSRIPQELKLYQTNAYGHLLFIDGKTAATDADINGHEFIGGGWRTYSRRPVVLDNCSNLHLVNVPFEFSVIGGQPDTGNQQFIATANTRNVHILNSRNMTYDLFDHGDFGDVVEKLMLTNSFYGDFLVGSKGVYLRMSATGGGNDPRIQFTRDSSSSESGMVVRFDVSDSDSLSLTKSGEHLLKVDGFSGVVSMKRMAYWPAGAPLEVSSGEIAITQSNHVINASGSPNVTIINGGIDGEIVKLSKSGAGTVALSEGGNIVTPGTSIALTAISDTVTLFKSGTNWLVSSFSDNA